MAFSSLVRAPLRAITSRTMDSSELASTVLSVVTLKPRASPKETAGLRAPAEQASTANRKVRCIVFSRRVRFFFAGAVQLLTGRLGVEQGAVAERVCPARGCQNSRPLSTKNKGKDRQSAVRA